MSTNSFDYNDKEFQDMLRQYEKAVRNGENFYLDADDMSDISEYYYETGKTDEAYEVMRRALEMFPGAAAPLAFMARVSLLTHKNPEKAREYAEMISDKTDQDYVYLSAEIMIYCGEVEQADSYLESSLGFAEDRELFMADVAKMYADYSEMDYADKWLSRCKPVDDDIYLSVKAGIEMADGNYREAEDLYKKLLDRDPFSAEYWDKLASVQLLNHDQENAIKSSEFALAINPSDKAALYNKAHAFYELGNMEESVALFDRYSKLDADDEMGNFAVGLLYMEQKNNEKALQYLKKANEAARKNGNIDVFIDSLRDMAIVSAQVNDYEAAMRYVGEMRECDECDSNETRVAEGIVYLVKGDGKEADNCFQTAMSESDNAPAIILQVVDAFYQNGYVQRAHDLLTMLYATRGDDLDIGYAYYAACSLELGDEAGFKNALKIACERNPEEAQTVLSPMFPPGLNPSEYYDYIVKEENNSF